MKNILKTIITIVAVAFFATSCTTSKKQKCDAYGNISSIEKTQNEVILTNFTLEAKS